jgi:hypothetical protein
MEGERRPPFGGSGGVKGRVSYPVKAHHNGHNLSIEYKYAISLPLGKIRLASFGVGGPTPNSVLVSKPES